MEKKTDKVYKKLPIDDLLKPFNPDTDLIVYEMTVLIDKEGKFSQLDKKNVRILNGALDNKSDEGFGRLITFINDYISFSIYPVESEGLIILTADISDDTKPTDIQLEAFLNYCDKLRKSGNKNILFSAGWRWTSGGGTARNVSTKLPSLFRKKLLAEIDNHLFRGPNAASIWYSVIE